MTDDRKPLLQRGLDEKCGREPIEALGSCLTRSLARRIANTIGVVEGRERVGDVAARLRAHGDLEAAGQVLVAAQWARNIRDGRLGE